MNKVFYCCFLLGAELSAEYLLRKCTTEIYQWTLFKCVLGQGQYTNTNNTNTKNHSVD